jgi:glycosyltransferase involved in cell wall biosynthesis
LPDVNLFIIGPNAPSSIKKLNSSKIHVLGFIPNLEEHFAKYRIMLSPLRYGAGIKGKITQSLTRGLPLVTTSIGAEGISLKNEHNCMIADEPQKFAESAIKLYTNPELWKKISINGLIVSKDFSAETIRNTLDSLFSKISK